MHPKNHPPVFVPSEYVAEMDRLTKAALMDLVWQLATETCRSQPTGTANDDIITEIRGYAAVIVTYRDQQL